MCQYLKGIKMLTSEQKEELMTYLSKRFEYIRESVASAETFLKEERDRYAKQATTQGELSPGIQDALHDIDYGLSTTFRYCFLVAVCSFVDDFLKKVGALTVTDYDRKFEGFKGNWLNKHLRVLKSETGINIAPVNDQIVLFKDIVTVRNAIVHQWGKVETSRNKKILETIIGKYDWIKKSADGYIYLNDNAISTALVAVREIVQHILDNTQ
jgi:hypothetical protein